LETLRVVHIEVDLAKFGLVRWNSSTSNACREGVEDQSETESS